MFFPPENAFLPLFWCQVFVMSAAVISAIYDVEGWFDMCVSDFPRPLFAGFRLAFAD